MSDTNTQTPGWIWLLSGLVIGLFIAFLVYVKNKNDILVQNNGQENAIRATVNTTPSDDNEKQSPTKFEFYKLLPKGEIKLNDQEPAQQPPQQQAERKSILPSIKEPAQQEKPANKPLVSINTQRSPEAVSVAEAGQYVLQVGSFQDYEEADALKAQLAFAGIEARIESVTLHNGAQWHRVRVGPSEDLKYINSVQRDLRANNFSAMLMKMPK